MFKKILVPMDLSDRSKKALNAARKLAIANGAKVTLLHVIEPIPHTDARELADFYATLEAKATRWMHRLTTLTAGPRVSAKIVYGKRARTIAEFAHKQRSDLIILSSHRVKPGSGFPSISYEVAVLASCPVLLIK